MPLQNRVTPLGEIVAIPDHGLFTGNRGIIHDAATRTLLRRRWANRAWLICTLQYRDRRRFVMGAGSWTELFFLDEATALAAGHRPCFLCRRAAAVDFQARFPRSGHAASLKARDMDRVLHAERLVDGRKRLSDLTMAAADLPDGAMVLQQGAPYLVRAGRAYRWNFSGYGPPTPLGAAPLLVTPPSTVMVLKAGYRPALHPSAGDCKPAEL